MLLLAVDSTVAVEYNADNKSCVSIASKNKKMGGNCEYTVY